MIALQFFVRKTRLGKSMRAVSEDGQAAILMGINKNRTITMTFAIGSGLAAVAVITSYSIHYTKLYENGGHGYVLHCHIIDHEDNEMMRPNSVQSNVNATRTLIKGTDY